MRSPRGRADASFHMGWSARFERSMIRNRDGRDRREPKSKCRSRQDRDERVSSSSSRASSATFCSRPEVETSGDATDGPSRAPPRRIPGALHPPERPGFDRSQEPAGAILESEVFLRGRATTRARVGGDIIAIEQRERLAGGGLQVGLRQTRYEHAAPVGAEYLVHVTHTRVRHYRHTARQKFRELRVARSFRGVARAKEEDSEAKRR